MLRGSALALVLATSVVVTAPACGDDDASSESSSSGGSSSSGSVAGSDGSTADGGAILSADGSSGGSDDASPEASSEAGGDVASGGPKWKCSDKTRTYQNAGACQNAHDLLCQPTKAGVDDGLPCPSLGEIYITCGACNAQDDFAARDCLCM